MLESYWLTGVLTLVTLVLGLLVLTWLWPTPFHSVSFGPALFVYKYHVGSFSGLLPTLKQIETAFEAANAKQRLISEINLHSQDKYADIQVLQSGIFFDDPKTVDSSELRSAVGMLIPLPIWNEGGYDVLKPTKLLKSLKLSDARVRFLPKSRFRVTHFPLLLGSLSYLAGAMRVYGKAAGQGFIKCAPMEIFDHAKGSFKETAVMDRMVTYLFAQDNLAAFQIDSDMSLPRDQPS